MYYSIGEFSKLTNLTPKMLKLYQEKELLIPAKVDEFSKYRYYDQDNLETAKMISFFKQFDFSLAEIKEIIDNQDDEAIVTELLEKQKDVIKDKITKYNFVMGLINEKLIRRTTMTEINSTSKQRSKFWKIVAKLLKQDISVVDSLKTAGKNADEELKAVLPDIINEVKQDKKLYDILNEYKTVFTELERMVIEAGVETDHLTACFVWNR
ncbi:MAG: MerR family transcriptional regulator [Candidatus Delongbacteria bacterium]|nr:MerR family transcriptional regulator [Candidatus Delongbacteria bacterium]